jgi:hypothetical protein
MVRRKATVCRVQPSVPMSVGITYESLKDGDCFLWDGDVWMKFDCGGQEGIRVKDGYREDDFCDKGVIIPVDIQVTWKKK